LFISPGKSFKSIWEVSRASQEQNNEATYMVSCKKRLEGITTGTILPLPKNTNIHAMPITVT